MIFLVRYLNNIQNNDFAVSEAIAKKQRELEKDYGPCVDLQIISLKHGVGLFEGSSSYAEVLFKFEGNI